MSANQRWFSCQKQSSLRLTGSPSSLLLTKGDTDGSPCDVVLDEQEGVSAEQLFAESEWAFTVPGDAWPGASRITTSST